jgi:predicted NAD/FAD-dependent oxidoreductase
MNRVVVVGAGLAGLACARRLLAAGLEVEVIEKSRGVSGRCSTRYSDAGRFDHGAQYFTVESAEFAAQVSQWQSSGHAAPWYGDEALFEDGFWTHRPDARKRWVGVPGMNSLGQALSEGLDISLRQRVTGLQREAGRWRVSARLDIAGQLGDPVQDRWADVVVLAIPSVQALDLLPAGSPASAAMQRASMLPCWAVMLAFEQPLDVPAPILRFRDQPVAWMARESSKPGRAPGERWTLHLSPTASQAWLEETPDSILARVKAWLEERFGVLPACHHAAAHRWRYALAGHTVDSGFVWDGAMRLGVCGDACAGPRIEAAWGSGHTLAAQVLTSLQMP